MALYSSRWGDALPINPMIYKIGLKKIDAVQRPTLAAAMPKKTTRSRKVDLRKIRPTQTYDLKQLANVTERKIETIWRWRRDGMPTLEGSDGKLVYGAEFKTWMKARQQARKRPCAIDEFYCFSRKCRTLSHE